MISRSSAFVQPEILSNAKGRTGNETGSSIQIWMVDDNDTFRSLLAELLGYENDFVCSRQFPSAEAVLEALPLELPPDVILLDIRMGGLSGLDAVRPIKRLACSTTVLMLTTFYDSHARAQAMRDGAADLLLKSYSLEEIAQRIRQAHRQSCGQSEFSETASVAGVSSHSKDDTLNEVKSGESGHGGERQVWAEKNSRNRSWREASNRWARGVSYLRTLLRVGRETRQSGGVVDSLGSGREIDCISE